MKNILEHVANTLFAVAIMALCFILITIFGGEYPTY